MRVVSVLVGLMAVSAQTDRMGIENNTRFESNNVFVGIYIFLSLTKLRGAG